MKPSARVLWVEALPGLWPSPEASGSFQNLPSSCKPQGHCAPTWVAPGQTAVSPKKQTHKQGCPQSWEDLSRYAGGGAGRVSVKQFPPAGQAAEGGVGVERSERAGRSEERRGHQ